VEAVWVEVEWVEVEWVEVEWVEVEWVEAGVVALVVEEEWVGEVDCLVVEDTNLT
jgi:hypothetical protein